ncbi:MAG TPA: hypothetical protein VFY14_15665 [Streptomyces sp.]|nr:hypothetical protein [Streptomyces sp.]
MAEDRRALIALIEHRDGSTTSRTWTPLAPDQIAEATADLGEPTWHKHTPADRVRDLKQQAAQAAVVVRTDDPGQPTG